MVTAWAGRGHKALVFAQTRQALDILEAGLRAAGLACLRMDGGTPIRARARLVDAFNADALPPPSDLGAASHRARWRCDTKGDVKTIVPARTAMPPRVSSCSAIRGISGAGG